MNTSKTYVEAIGRNPGEEKQHSHLYLEEDGDYFPMCAYGWNRSDGYRISIFRGNSGDRGLCEICRKRRDADLPPFKDGAPHKTKCI